MAVYLVKVLSSADLLAQLQGNGVESTEDCKRRGEWPEFILNRVFSEFPLNPDWSVC